MTIRGLKMWLIKGLVVTLPFGWWSPLPLPYTGLTFLFIYFYLALSILTFSESFSFVLFKRYAVPLLVIWVIMLTMTYVFYNPNAEGASSVLRQFLFFGVFFAFALRDIGVMARRGQVLHGTYLVAVVGIILAFFGGFSRDFGDTGRHSLVGINPNMVALYCVTGFLVLVDALLNRRGIASTKWARGISIVGLAFLAVIIALTGSRTGVFILLAGLVVYFTTWSQVTMRSLLALVPVGVLTVAAVWLIYSSDVMSSRMSEMDEDIRVTLLWPTAIEVLLEYPVFGSGLGYIEEVVASRTGRYFSLHNEFLKVATASGIVGLTLFLIFLKRLFDRAVISRQVTGSGLHISLWLIVVLYLIPGGGALAQPLIWVVFLMLSSPAVSRGVRQAAAYSNVERIAPAEVARPIEE